MKTWQEHLRRAAASHLLPLLQDRLISVTLIWVPALETGFQHLVRPILKFPPPLLLCLHHGCVLIWVSGSRISLHKRLGREQLMSYTAHLQLNECSWREQPQQPEIPAWHNTAGCQGLVLTADQCNTSSDRNTLVLAVSSWLRTALSSIIQDIITFLPICLWIMSQELYKRVKFLFLNLALPMSGNTHKGKMDRQEVPLAACSVTSSIGTAGSWGGSSTGARKLRSLGAGSVLGDHLTEEALIYCPKADF